MPQDWTPKSGKVVASTTPVVNSNWDSIKKGLKRFAFGPEPEQWSEEEINKLRNPEPDNWLEKALPYLSKRRTDFANALTPEQNKPVPGQEESILPKFDQPETWTGGALNSLYEDFIRPFGTPSGALGSLGVKPVPKIDPKLVQQGIDATRLARKTAGLDAPTPPKGLPPAPNEVINKPRFFSGPAGTADANQQYLMDIGPVKPYPGQQGIGTVLPQEVGGISELPAMEAARLGTTLGRIADIEPTLDGVRRGKSQGGRVPKVGRHDDGLGSVGHAYSLY
jgi:hypothetical protein